MKRWAILWLLLIALAASSTLPFQETIQEHHLQDSLTRFHDVFGRNIVLLTLNATLNSFLTIIPLSFVFLFLGASIAIALSSLRRYPVASGIVQGFIDTLAALPGLLIALAFSAFGGSSTASISLATLLVILPHITRFFESQVTHFKQQSFYIQSESLGGTSGHRIRVHLFPELVSLGTVFFPVVLSRLLYIETTLSFLGVGPQSNTDSWGQLLNQGREYMLEAPWLILVSGTPLLLCLWSFHLLTQENSR